MAAVSLDSASKIYPGGVRAVSELGLRVANGEFLVLLGPSGCGKTTVLRMIAGLEDITSGSLWLDDKLANDMTPRERNVAMVFQSGALYPHRSIRGNLAFPLQLAGENSAEIKEKVVELSRALKIDQTLDRLPASLSGGQRQRAAMGRAIIREPSVFLMDEPLSNLDAALRTDLRLEIGALVRGLGVTTVYVTHDQVEALTLADRIAVLRDGRLEDLGTPSQVYEDPATAFVAAFLGAPQINLLAGRAYARPGEGSVALDFGGQAIRVPWTDPRAEFLAGRNGDQIIAGIRSDSLVPRTDPVAGAAVSGRLRALEYHGHEWLAYVETGLHVIDSEDIGQENPQAAPGAPPAPATLADRVRSLLGLAPRRNGRPAPGHEGRPAGHTSHTSQASQASHTSQGSQGSQASHTGEGSHAGHAGHAGKGGQGSHAGHAGKGGQSGHVGSHRRADLIVRLQSGRGWQIGSTVHLAIDLPRVLFFDESGRRVDPVMR